MVVRLDPGLPVVWRTPKSLQIGLDPARVVLSDVSAVQERLLAAVATGTTPLALAALAGRGEAAQAEAAHILKLLEPALERPGRSVRGHVAVCGTDPTVDRIANLLGAEGVRVSIVREEHSAETVEPDVAVIVAHFVLAPWQLSFWLRRDVPQLPVVFSDTGVSVGPVLTPGRGPCLYCLELHRTDADAAWPALATQLLGRRGYAETTLRSTEAATLATRRVLAALGDEHAAPDPAGADRGFVVLGVNGRSTRPVPERHDDCLCSAEALQGIGSDTEPSSAQSPAPPTTGSPTSAHA
jgi:hypothetical protein